MLEYASIVWVGCSKQDAEKLENVQLTAARIVTGLPIFVSREALYYETSWETLKNQAICCKNDKHVPNPHGGSTRIFA